MAVYSVSDAPARSARECAIFWANLVVGGFEKKKYRAFARNTNTWTQENEIIVTV
jgi:hypothetical protein